MPASQNTKEDLSFEQALEKLEAIVESMESGNLALEELVTQYEKGDVLLRYCNGRLKDAELKIEKLKANSADQFEPFESEDE